VANRAPGLPCKSVVGRAAKDRSSSNDHAVVVDIVRRADRVRVEPGDPMGRTGSRPDRSDRVLSEVRLAQAYADAPVVERVDLSDQRTIDRWKNGEVARHIQPERLSGAGRSSDGAAIVDGVRRHAVAVWKAEVDQRPYGGGLGFPVERGRVRGGERPVCAACRRHEDDTECDLLPQSWNSPSQYRG